MPPHFNGTDAVRYTVGQWFRPVFTPIDNIMYSEESRSRIRTICLVVLTAAVVTYLIFWLRPVLVPLVVAMFVVSGVGPILKTLENRLGVTRIVAAFLTFLAGVVILVVFGCSLWVSVADLSSNSDAYRARVGEIVEKVESIIPDRFSRHDEAQRSAEPTVAKDEKGDSINVGEPVAARPSRAARKDNDVSDFVDAFLRDAITVVSQTFISLVSTSVIVLIYVFFLLLGTPTNINHSETLRDVDRQIRSYLALKTVISIITGFAFGLALWLFGVPMAMTFGVLAFLLNFIPNVGPLVASLLPIPLIVLDPQGSIGWMVAVISVTAGIQLISGNIVEPKLMGQSSDLHPVTILLALMFWGMMWGIIGMFLATPIMAGIKLVLERIEATRPIAALMAGRLPRDSAAGEAG